MILNFNVHARTSTASRAASFVSNSALTPTPDATPVAKTATHHSEGMLSRCHHLLTADAPAPISAAIASREGQSSIIDLKLVKSVMERTLGHLVLKRKANLSLDAKLSLGHTVHMAESETEAQYKQQFMARVAEARIARGLKQWQLAEALGMAQDKYKQYEGRSLLPHHLIGRFCIITRVEPEWLLTGRGQKPIKGLHIAETEEASPIPKPKRTRAKRAA